MKDTVLSSFLLSKRLRGTTGHRGRFRRYRRVGGSRTQLKFYLVSISACPGKASFMLEVFKALPMFLLLNNIKASDLSDI